MAKVAINGFGRIGRSFFREAFSDPYFDIVAINDLTDPTTLVYLLKYDSAHGKFNAEIKEEHNSLMVNGKVVKVFAEKDPAKLPWKDMQIDLVIESTGFFTSSDKAQAHLDAGSKRVLITAPAKGDVDTLLIGVNDEGFKNPKRITCNASCTTNSVAPVVYILNSEFGIEKASMTTVHGYTATQKLVDGPDAKDLRRGRAAALNIIPSTTGAAKAVIQSIPELEGKFDAIAIRVPVITGSISVTTALLKKDTSVEEVNGIFSRYTKEERWSKSIAVTNEKLVSTDIIGEPYGAIVDLNLTKVQDGNLATVYSWYDNESGYTATLVEHAKRIADLA